MINKDYDIFIKKVDETRIRILAEDSIRYELSDEFKFEIKHAKYQKHLRDKIRAGLWDGFIRMFNMKTNIINYGLLYKIIEFARVRNYKIKFDEEIIKDNKKQFNDEDIIDYLNKIPISNNGSEITLNYYQEDAIIRAIKRNRALIISPTGSGKTLITYMICRWHLSHQRRTVIIVPTTSLVEQTYKEFNNYSSNDSFFNNEEMTQKLYQGHSKDITKNILITTWQSIYNMPKEWLNQFDALIGDESHNFKATSLSKLIESMDTIKYRIGVTGTIDNKKVHELTLNGLFGDTYKVTTTRKLINEGKLADIDINCLILKYPKDVCKYVMDIHKIMKDEKEKIYKKEIDFIVTNVRRNQLIANIANKQVGNTLVLFQFVDLQGKPLYDMIKETAGDKEVYYVSGEIDTETREDIRKKASESNNLIIVASYGTYSTGINIPSIQNIIFASPSKSKIRNLQSIGRGLRLTNGKTKCTLIDIGDDLSVGKTKNYSLRHLLERQTIYAQEEFNVKTFIKEIEG